jgi:hypothetical protein
MSDAGAMNVTLTFVLTPIGTGIRMLVGLLQLATASPTPVPSTESTTPPAIERSAEPTTDGSSQRDERGIDSPQS